MTNVSQLKSLILLAYETSTTIVQSSGFIIHVSDKIEKEII
jgi:hypothetical protein